MNADQRRAVSDVVARGMRRAREARGKVLADVGAAAREVGLNWDAAAVSRIETGKRQLTFEEFLALPDVLTLACDEPVTLSELVAPDGRETIATTTVLPLLAEAYWTTDRLPEWESLRGYVTKDLDRAKREVQLAGTPAEEKKSAEEWREIAEAFGVTAGEVRGALLELSKKGGTWGSPSLYSERERRLLQSGEDLSNPTRIRTVRGWITRELMQELGDYFAAKEEGRHGLDQETTGRPVASPLPRSSR
jgi:hypothetical protein